MPSSSSSFSSKMRAAALLLGLLLCPALTGCGNTIGENYHNPNPLPTIGNEGDTSSDLSSEDLQILRQIPVSADETDHLSGGSHNYTYTWGEDSLTVETNGVLTAKYSFDASGVRTSLSEYDRNGRLVSLTQYDKKGEERLVCHYEYDQNGHKIHEEAYDGDGEFVRYLDYNALGAPTGGYLYSFEYDAYDRILRETYEEFSSASEEARNSTTEYHYRYGEDGQLLEKLTYTAEGLLEEKCEYDEDGLLLRDTFFDRGGTTSVIEYDRFGNETGRISYTADPDTGETPPEEEWVRTESPIDYEYDEEGRITGWTSYDEDGTSVLSRYTAVYGEDGALLSELYAYGNGYIYDGFETSYENGVLRKKTDYTDGKTVTEYDEQGRVTRTASYGTENTLLDAEEILYDDAGHIAERRTYQEDGLDSRSVYTYGAFDKVIRMERYDQYGNLDYTMEMDYQNGNLKNAVVYNGSGSVMTSYSASWKVGEEAQLRFAEKYLKMGLL